jgi:signal transduction histidine kinase
VEPPEPAAAHEPLPPPWNGAIDARSDGFHAFVASLTYTDPSLALAICREALAQAQGQGDDGALANALFRTMLVLRSTGQAHAANDIERRIRGSAHAVDDPVLALRMQLHESLQLHKQGRYAQALIVNQRVLGSALALGRHDLAMQSLNNAGVVLIEIEEYDLAIEVFEQIEPWLPSGSAGAQASRSRILNNLAMVWLGRARLQRSRSDELSNAAALERARALAEAASALVLPLKNDRAKLIHLDTLVQVLLASGDVGAARECADRLQAALGTLPLPGSEEWGLLHLVLARVAVRVGDDLHAVLGSLRALEQLQSAVFQSGVEYAEVQSALLQVHERLGNHEQALECHKRWTHAQACRNSAAMRERVDIMRNTLLAMRGEAFEFVTHDLRNPLAALIARLQSLSLESLSTAARRQVDAAAAGTRDALDVADQYLGVLRAEYMPPSELRPLDLGELADDVCEAQTLRPVAEVHIVRDIDIGAHVRGDRALLMRALSVLLANALRHAPVGSSVHVCVARQGFGDTQEVRLSVTDAGAGLPLPVRRRLYQRFADGLPDDTGGLGLALVARVARLHRARLVVHSTPGRSTTVSLGFKVGARRNEELAHGPT